MNTNIAIGVGGALCKTSMYEIMCSNYTSGIRTRSKSISGISIAALCKSSMYEFMCSNSTFGIRTQKFCLFLHFLI